MPGPAAQEKLLGIRPLRPDTYNITITRAHLSVFWNHSPWNPRPGYAAVPQLETKTVTVDEELSLLESSVRKLKIEYDIFFGGGAKKPPADTEFRVQSLIKKYSDSQRLNFGQRFRYNSIVQRYSLYSVLWQQKLKIKDEGYRRPADARLGIAGMRIDEEKAAAPTAPAHSAESGDRPFVAYFSDVDSEHDRVMSLYTAMVEAKNKAGEKASSGNPDSFKAFVKKKTEEIRREYGCSAVEYSVEMENGQVKLKAKAKT